MPFDATLLVQLAANYTPANSYDFQSPSGGVPYAVQFAFHNGSDVNEAERIFADKRTVAASTNDDLDLSGTLADVFGSTLAFTKVKGLLIRSEPANTQDITVGGGTNPFVSWLGGTTPTVVIKPGGLLLLVAPDDGGYEVTADTGDILRVSNGAGSEVTYDIVVFGV